MKTFSAKAEEVERKWHLIDAKGQVVGRIAEKITNVLRGKNKPIFTSHVDTGDNIIVINAEKAIFTGKKEVQKEYMTYSGYVGGEKYETVKNLRQRRPELIIHRAVWGMMPKNRLGRAIIKKLHIYAGEEHPHTAQQPQPLSIN